MTPEEALKHIARISVTQISCPKDPPYSRYDKNALEQIIEIAQKALKENMEYCPSTLDTYAHGTIRCSLEKGHGKYHVHLHKVGDSSYWTQDMEENNYIIDLEEELRNKED
jgi:hypothetical protein